MASQVVREGEVLPDILELMKIADITQEDVENSVEKWKKAIKKSGEDYNEFSNLLDDE